MSFIFTFSYTGFGISKEKIDSIYDSFSQEGINNKRKFGGLGLGLYIVKTLANLHNGKVDLQSILDQGTVCKITLEYQTVVVEKKEVPIVEVADYDLKGKTILVVEDNAMNQMVIKMITKKWLNTTVEFANNGEEGVKKLTENHYDIILMDLQMPIMDGLSSAKAIRQYENENMNPLVPIVAMTAHVLDSDRLACKEAGMDDFLVKPVAMSEFERVLSTFVANRVSDSPTMTSQETNMKYLDIKGAQDRLGDDELLQQMLEMLAESLPEETTQFNALMAENKLQEAARVLHKIKGVIPLFCDEATVRILQQLEVMLQHNEDTPEMREKLAALLERLDQFKSELTQWLANS